MKTLAGHFLGRKNDSADPRDHHFGVVHSSLLSMPLPTIVDLSSRLPPAFDQGNISSCGPNSGAALMKFLYPQEFLFSRLEIYANVRTMENDFNSDDGVETRDVLKSLVKDGAGPEAAWPYNVNKLFVEPPPLSPNRKIISYSRLISREDFLGCLANGYPFILGFTCFESIDSDVLAKTGIMALPDPKREKQIGGHDVLVVGYNLRFKQSESFKKSGIDPILVEDEMLYIRNSWGTHWGVHGHFHMPLSYALNPTTGGDAWTGRL